MEGRMMKNRGSKILVVDDLKSMRRTLGGILEDEGHKVVTAENGYQAIESVKGSHFDIIFMDIKMPGINGVQAFREIKKVDPEAAVIMMTAYSVEDLVKEALEQGAYTVVYKPFDIDRITAIIEELLHGKNLVLVVNDQYSEREMLKGILEAKVYRVATAKDGAEAIEMVKSKHYDVIFLDVWLPDMDGVETLKQIRKIDSQTRVIMITGYNEEDLAKRATSHGAYTYIYKPFDIEKITTLVEDATKERAG